MCGDFRATRHLQVAQPPLSAGLTSNSLNRIKEAGLRNREEKHVSPARCGPSLNADEALCNQVQCTDFSRYWKKGLSAESQPHPQLPWDGDWIVCQLTGRSPVLLRGSLSRKRRCRRNP